jgi:putative peptide zinc metalloprotease protein
VEIVHHDRWVMMFAPRSFAHVRLSPDEAAFVASLDGSHSPAAFLDLVGELRTLGFLVDSPAVVAPKVVLTRNGVEFTGLHRVVAGFHRRFAPLWNLPVRLLFFALALLAPVLFGFALTSGHSLVAPVHPLVAACTFLALLFAISVAHELGHAVVLVHYGRTVGRCGFGFYWGALTFFVDASDSLMLPKRERLFQAAAGVMVEFVLCGVACVAVLVVGPGSASSLLLQFVVLSWVNVTLNLVPFLELDGYWLLSDACDEPQLRARAITAVHGPRRTAIDRRLALYGIASTVFGIGVFASSIAGWWAVVGDVVRQLFNGSPVDIAVAVILVLPTAMAAFGAVVQVRTLPHV